MKRRFMLIIARLKKKFTTVYMAIQLGVTRNQYSNFENGHTQILKKTHLKKMAELLDLPEELIELKEDKIIFNHSKIGLFKGEITTQTNHFADEQLMKVIEKQQETINKLQEMLNSFFTKEEKP